MSRLRHILYCLLLALLITLPAQADIVLPTGTTVVEAQAFTNDTSLTGMLVIPESVTEIGAEAFSSCTGLTQIDFSGAPVTIGSKAFANCTGLSGKLYLPESSIVAEDAFDGCNVTVIVGVPDGYPAIVPSMIQSEPTTFTVYDFWSGDGTRSENPTDAQQKVYDYYDWIEATYNVKIVQKAGGNWGTCATEMINFVSAPDGSLRAYIIEPGKVGSLIKGNAAASWGSSSLSSSLWNSAVVDLLTINGQHYGAAAGANHEPRQLLFFNKRILEEAGIDWSSIYDMQAAGTWTWSAFERLMKQVMRDTDNDGVIDIWGLTGSNTDLYTISVFANGASFFDFDASGDLQPTMNSEAAMYALNWARDVYNTYFYKSPEDGSWDYYKTAWKEGKAAFYIYQAYGGFNNNSEMSGMADDWGAVAFPLGNGGTNYVTVISQNTVMIPSVYNGDAREKVTFFLDLWAHDVNGSSWVGNKCSLTDSRAVYETYGMLRKGSHGICDKTTLLGSQNDVLGPSLLWSLESSTPAELVEAGLPTWQALCDDFNAN